MRLSHYERLPRSEEPESKERSGKIEDFKILTCPTPGCRGFKVFPHYHQGKIEGFECSAGCKYSVKRNVFDGAIMYFQLEEFDRYRIAVPSKVSRGMRFTDRGEKYYEWY
ncbi:MAG TPA: hypothetical protein VGB30_09810 [bacterium]|jgi:hypothetical protein